MRQADEPCDSALWATMAIVMARVGRKREAMQTNPRMRISRNSGYALLAVLSLAGLAGAQESTLSLEETVGLGLLGVHFYDSGGAIKPYLDPAAKRVIMDAFPDVKTKYHIGMFGVLGILANSRQDLLFVESHLLEDARRINESNKTQDDIDWVASRMAGEEGVLAIANMSRNGVAGAKELLLQMTYPEYWSERGIQGWTSTLEGLVCEGMLCAVGFAASLYPEEFPDVPRMVAERLESADIPLTPEQKLKLNGIVDQYAPRLRHDEVSAREKMANQEWRRALMQSYERFAGGAFNRSRGPDSEPSVSWTPQPQQDSVLKEYPSEPIYTATVVAQAPKSVKAPEPLTEVPQVSSPKPDATPEPAAVPAEDRSIDTLTFLVLCAIIAAGVLVAFVALRRKRGNSHHEDEA